MKLESVIDALGGYKACLKYIGKDHSTDREIRGELRRKLNEHGMYVDFQDEICFIARPTLKEIVTALETP